MFGRFSRECHFLSDQYKKRLRLEVADGYGKPIMFIFARESTSVAKMLNDEQLKPLLSSRTFQRE